jgi:surface protein
MNFTKTKKVVAAGLSALMMMSSITSVFAAEPDSKTTTLNYEVSSRYDWIIHSAIDFGADAGVGKTVDRTGNQVKVLKNVIPEGKYLNISVKGSGANDAFTVDNGGSEVLNYDVSDDNGAVGVNENVLSVPAGTNTATQNMNFKLNTKKGSAEVAGNYNGHVIYNAEVGGKDGAIQKEKSSTIIGTVGDGESATFQFLETIPKAATAIVFTDEVAPKGVSTTDLTVAKDGDVVGWLDGATWKVSTQDPNKAVTFNENCLGMFCNPRLTRISFDNIDTSNVTSMNGMFADCENLKELDLSNFNTKNITNMGSMFYKCTNLTSLDLSGFDTSNVTNMYSMFSECSNLANIYVGSKWSTEKVTNDGHMFEYCEKLPNFDFNTTDVTKAHTGPDGYLTLKQ